MIDFTKITGEDVQDYIWHGNDGDYHPREMVNRHLCNSLRLVWNNFCPDIMRVGRYVKRECNTLTFSSKYITNSVNALIFEINRRAQFEEVMDNPVPGIMEKLKLLWLKDEEEDII